MTLGTSTIMASIMTELLERGVDSGLHSQGETFDIHMSFEHYISIGINDGNLVVVEYEKPPGSTGNVQAVANRWPPCDLAHPNALDKTLDEIELIYCRHLLRLENIPISTEIRARDLDLWYAKDRRIGKLRERINELETSKTRSARY